MLKSELIKKLNEIEGDYEVTLQNTEAPDGYMNFDVVSVEDAHKITDDGLKRCPESGTDFYKHKSKNTDWEEKWLKELYEKDVKKIIVLKIYA